MLLAFCVDTRRKQRISAKRHVVMQNERIPRPVVLENNIVKPWHPEKPLKPSRL